MMFGKFFYTEMANSNATLAPFFFYPFIMAFYYIVMSFFSVSAEIVNWIGDNYADV